MSTARARTAHAKAILGPELHAQLPNTKVLLVGAGGIGCELCEYMWKELRLRRLNIWCSIHSEKYCVDGLRKDYALGPGYD